MLPYNANNGNVDIANYKVAAAAYDKLRQSQVLSMDTTCTICMEDY